MNGNRRKRIIFMMLVTALLLILPMHPLLAQDVYDIEYNIAYHELPYGNGIDDDGDGVIDNIEEDDVEYGNVDLNDTTSLIYQWNDTFNTEHGDWNLIENGIAIAAIHDQLWNIESSDNGSVNAFADACYVYEMGAEHFYRDYGLTPSPILVSQKTLPVLKFNVEFSPGDIMNGAQQIWYRSPLAYDADKYDGHILNIYRASDSQLVWANHNETNRWTFETEYPQIRKDNSTVGAASDYWRVYYRLNFPLRTDVEYRIEEYVILKEDNPVNDVQVFMAIGQDLSDDGLQTTYILPGTSNARMIPQDPSWSMLFKLGIGPSGTEVPIPATLNHYNIHTNAISGNPAINHVKSVRVIIPLRVTALLDDVDIELVVMSGGNSDDCAAYEKIEGVGGTMIFDFNLNGTDSDPHTGEPNQYALRITVDALGAGADGSDYAYWSLYPSDGDAVLFTTCGEMNGSTELWFCNFAFHFEVIEFADYLVAPAESTAEDTSGWWIGLAIALIGISLIILSPPLGFVVLSMGIATGMSLGIAGGIIGAGVVVGVYLAQQGFTIMGGGDPMGFLEWAASGISRVFSGVVAGISALTSGALAIVFKVIEAALMLGDAVFHYSGIILMVVVEIIYFVAFLFVLMGWMVFLNTMKYVMKGEYEMAWKQFRKPVMRAAKLGTKVAKTAILKGAGTATKAYRSSDFASQRRGISRGRLDYRAERSQGKYGAGHDYGHEQARGRADSKLQWLPKKGGGIE